MENGRVARFTKPENPREQWNAVSAHTLRYPHALASSGEGLLVGENSGKGSRLFVDDREIGGTDGLIAAYSYGREFILVSHNRVSLRR